MMINENHELSSGHSPIVLTISEHIIQKPHNQVGTVNKRTDWSSFKTELTRETDLSTSIATPEDSETELNK